MAFIWLVVRLLARVPDVQIRLTWNTWGIALAACAVNDLTGALSARAWRRPFSGTARP